VPGNRPAEAVKAYIEPLQQSLSCITNSIIRPSGYDVDTVLTVTLAQPTVDLLTHDGEVLRLSFAQGFSIKKSLLFSGYKITTRSYMYALENESHHEIISYHWHPDTESETTTPHFHIGYGAGDRLRSDVRKCHFPSGRIAFEQFCHVLIKHFGVMPERDDAIAVLEANLAIFEAHKTW
jgi:hypothetical protein